MCGRYTLTQVDPDALREVFDGLIIPHDIPKRYNIAPTQPVAVVPNDGKNHLDFFVWGLIPSWAKDPNIGSKLINARGETVAEKPSFRAAYKRRRCLMLADGFFEWVEVPGFDKKVPHVIRLKSKKPFAFAGLWETWFSPDGSEIKSCTIITTELNEKIAPLHNRMPVILPRESYEIWLDPGETEREELDPLLKPYPAEEMTYYPVSTLVNNPRNDVVEVLEPLDIE